MLQVEGRVDLAPEHALRVAYLGRVACRYEPRSPRELPPDGRALAGARHEDDREHTVRTLAEVPLQLEPRAVGVGSRDREDVREQPRQPHGRREADDEDEGPERQHDRAVAEDGAGPALGHELTLIRNADP